jgi:hypothetical protein
MAMLSDTLGIPFSTNFAVVLFGILRDITVSSPLFGSQLVSDLFYPIVISH